MSEPLTPLPVPGPRGCHGRNAKGGACGAAVVWNRDEYGVKTSPTLFCYRHSMSDEAWAEKAAKGGRTRAAEEHYRKLFVDPARARELLRVVVNVVNGTYGLQSALERLTPFFAQSEEDIGLLRKELERLKTFRELEDESRIAKQSELIDRMTSGGYY